MKIISAKDIDFKNFKENYFDHRTPVIIKDALEQWGLLSQWSNDYLKNIMRDKEFLLVRDSRPGTTKERCSLDEYFEYHTELTSFFYDTLDHSSSLPNILKDLPNPNPLFPVENIYGYFVYFGNKVSGTLPHYHPDAFNLLTTGIKKWAIYEADPDIAPEAWQTVQDFFKKYPQGSSAEDWFNNEIGVLEQAGHHVYVFEQQAGDIVFVPTHYAHAVHNLTKVSGLTLTMSERPDRPFKNRVLTSDRKY